MTAISVKVAAAPRARDRIACFLRARRIDQIQIPIAISAKAMIATSNSAIGERLDSAVIFDWRIG